MFDGDVKALSSLCVSYAFYTPPPLLSARQGLPTGGFGCQSRSSSAAVCWLSSRRQPGPEMSMACRERLDERYHAKARPAAALVRLHINTQCSAPAVL